MPITSTLDPRSPIDSEHQTKIALSIEDDPATQALLAAAFEGTGFNLVQVSTVAEGLAYVSEHTPAVILLDLSLPDATGFEFIASLRNKSKVPILVLSGSSEEPSKLQALYAGAEDYITKPFGVGELIARVKVALRHVAQAHPAKTSSEFGDLRIDLERREVFVRGERVGMTPLEFSLLSTLIDHQGAVVNHRELLRAVWGEDFTGESQYLRVYIGYLRRKIELDPSRPALLVTVPGVGYRLSR